MDKYRVNEIFRSIQGEGWNAGRDATFVRFTGCNLKCSMAPGPLSPGGFNCDTEFASGRVMTGDEIGKEIASLQSFGDHGPKHGGLFRLIVLTGGEPALQVDAHLVKRIRAHVPNAEIAIETNGSIAIDEEIGIDWITVSPKVAEHAILQKKAHELKYVRGYGQAIPCPSVRAEHKYISPAFDGPMLDTRTVEWCVQLVKENPGWRLTLQLHKILGVR